MPYYKDIPYRNAQRKKNYRRGKTFDQHSRQAWQKEEVKLLHESHVRGFTDRELAFELRRSVQAIQVKRSKTKGMFR